EGPARRVWREPACPRREWIDGRLIGRPEGQSQGGVTCCGSRIRKRRRTVKIPRKQYASLYGPTTGDRVRLADTDLIIEVEDDLTVPGEEAVFGGGKTIRDGMGQSARATSASGQLDTAITNALILDYTGVIKADIGIKDGRIVGIGKSGNSDLMPNV